MKKIVFSNLPMRRDLCPLKYPVDGNSMIEYDGEVIFPVNSVLARTLKKGDDVKVVLLSKTDIDGNSALNAGLFQQELNEINRKIDANIEYITLPTPFDERRDIHETLLKDLIEKLEDNAELIADVTYGPKTLPIVIFSVLAFAEKFFKCDIKNIIYGKVDFPNGSNKPENPLIYDLTPLYYLNAVTGAIECNDSSEAVKILDTLLSI